MRIKTILFGLLMFMVVTTTLFGQLGLKVTPKPDEPEGRSILITSPLLDSAESYELFVKYEDSDSWNSIKEIPIIKILGNTLETSWKITNDAPAKFKLAALSAEGDILAEDVSDVVVAKAMWFNTHRTVALIALIIISSLIIYYIERAKKAKEIYLRPIAGLKAFEEAVGRATEMGKSVLFVPGIQDLDQVETIAGVIILGHVSKMTARYETGLNVPVARSLVMEASREIVHESYLSEGRPDLFNPDMVHYLTDDQFAFAAGVNGIMLREKPAAIFMQGKFFAESLILAETGNSIGAIQIAGTASPAQIPFFITACDYTLIGEEFFAASAYLGKDPKLMGSIKGQDIAKAIIMISISLGVVLESFGFTFFREIFK